MSQLLEGIDATELLRRMPSNVRTSLETLERAGTDWNAVGKLLAGSANAGVAVAGTGQWTADLWQAVKWEFRSFLCTDSEPYAQLRSEWPGLKQRSAAQAVGSAATLIAARVGAERGVVAPLVTWLFVMARRSGEEAACQTLSATPSNPVQAQPLSGTW